MPKYTHIREGDAGTEKRCSRCLKWFPGTTDFYNRLWRGPLGFQSSCRKCQRTEVKALYDTPAGKAAIARYRKAHWQEYLDYHRDYHNRPDVKKRRTVAACIANRAPERRAYQAAWQQAKRDRLRASRA